MYALITTLVIIIFIFWYPLIKTFKIFRKYVLDTSVFTFNMFNIK